MTTDILENRSEVRGAGARSVLYHGLATLFQHPDQSWAETLRTGEIFVALREAAEAIGYSGCLSKVGAIERELAKHEGSLEPLSIDYVRLFGAHGGVNCPPFATEFGQRHSFSKAQDIADINGFYGAFGLTKSSEHLDRPDHIGFIFEFLSFLAVKQVDAIADANEDGLAVTTDAQEKFFCQYVGNWVPVFCDTLAAQAHQPFYRELAALTKDFVEAEEDRFGVPIERLVISDQKIDPEEDKCQGCTDS